MPELGREGAVALRNLRNANLALRFFLELFALGALAYWGFEAGGGPLTQVALGLGAPLLAAVAWGLFVAPRARFSLPLTGRLAVELAVFGSGTAALWARCQAAPAFTLAAGAVTNRALIGLWGQDERSRAGS